MITFAVFHYEMSAALQRRFIPHFADGPFDFVGMIDLALRSAERFHPRCRKVVVTDHETDLSRLPTDVTIVRHEIDPTHAMLDRWSAARAFLAQHDFSSHVLLLDSDILINADLELMFDGTFDVGLTYRNIKATPINAGVIAAHAGQRKAVLTFFDNLVGRVRAGRSDEPSRLWLSDQLGLIDAIGHEAFRRREHDRLATADGVRIRLWPCETHNDAVINEWRAIVGRNPNRRILHFKGGVKHLMEPYWHAHLDPGRGVAARTADRATIVGRACIELMAQGVKAPNQLRQRLGRAFGKRAGRLRDKVLGTKDA